MARKKATKEQTEEAGTEGKISKAEAVRQAIAEGVDKPQEAAEFIKQRFGIEITPQVFSSYKSNEKKKEEGQSGGRTRAPKASTANGDGSVELARQVKQLVERFGAGAVRDMTEVFAE